MMPGKILSLSFALCLVTVPAFASTLQLNPNAVNTSLFNVTQIATGLATPLATATLADGSLAVATYSYGLDRYTYGTGGVLNATSTSLYSNPGNHTALIEAGGYYILGNSGTWSGQPSIDFLSPGASSSAPMTSAATLQFRFPDNWEHHQMGLAARPTPGQTGSYDLVFNIGSEYDHQTSTDRVSVSGLVNATLDGDSLYVVTVDTTGATPTASSLRKLATGTRNVIGMGFQAGTGDFYFLDNAIDGPGIDGDEPPQAEEINKIAASDFNASTPLDFGYPNCYIQYRTGSAVGSGCIQPLFAIQPLANGTALGSEAEGVTQMVFAPTDFPDGYNNGIYIGFFGKWGVTGATNEENAIGYYSFADGSFIHFSENSQNGVYNPIGISATTNSLVISDWGSGNLYSVTVNPTPEPGTFFTAAFLLVLPLVRRILQTR